MGAKSSVPSRFSPELGIESCLESPIPVHLWGNVTPAKTAISSPSGRVSLRPVLRLTCRYSAKQQMETPKLIAAFADKVSSCSGNGSRATSVSWRCTKSRKRFVATIAALLAPRLILRRVFRSRSGRGQLLSLEWQFPVPRPPGISKVLLHRVDLCAANNHGQLQAYWLAVSSRQCMAWLRMRDSCGSEVLFITLWFKVNSGKGSHNLNSAGDQWCQPSILMMEASPFFHL